MTRNSGLYEARGQIGWILALIVSTAVVVWLEQLEVGSQLSVLATNPLTDTELGTDSSLQQAWLQVDDPATAAVKDQVNQLTALVRAGLEDGADIAALRQEAAQTIAVIESTDPTDRVLLDAIRLCRGVFNI
ncbi:MULTISPECIES: hypothetical protein [unclassified Yoonia]|uniref:hypothetical protein n=1 Tax=unclassified Yoonia TaxID=2629118 RepID=UPI002AFE3302|nr:MULTISPECIES: hypothetical protein [unclassified Yoonia]